jgi:hypothetical protein
LSATVSCRTQGTEQQSMPTVFFRGNPIALPVEAGT